MASDRRVTEITNGHPMKATSPYGNPSGKHHRGSAAPEPGRCGAKLRLSNPPRYCTERPLKGKRRCGLHGGKSKTGPASGTWKTGLRSKYLPTDLQERFDAALHDPQLKQIEQDLAHIEVLIGVLHRRLKPGRAVPASVESRILQLIDRRTRLLEAEFRRLKDLEQMIPAAQAFALIGRVMEIIRQVALQHFGDKALPFFKDLRTGIHQLIPNRYPHDDDSGKQRGGADRDPGTGPGGSERSDLKSGPPIPLERDGKRS